MISQLTVFLANEKGRLAAASRVLSDAGINMQALFIADTADFGIVRIFCDTPALAAAKLAEAGQCARLLEFCHQSSMNIEYGYCFAAGDGRAIDVLKIEGEGAEEALAAAGFKVLAPEEVYVVDPS